MSRAAASELLRFGLAFNRCTVSANSLLLSACIIGAMYFYACILIISIHVCCSHVFLLVWFYPIHRNQSSYNPPSNNTIPCNPSPPPPPQEENQLLLSQQFSNTNLPSQQKKTPPDIQSNLFG